MKLEETLTIIQIILSMVGAILFIILIFNISQGESNADKWRRTPEGNCLKDIAKEFCLERDMEFRKIYSPLYRSIWTSEDFSCIDRDIGTKYAFTRSEEEKCKEDKNNLNKGLKF